jgi:hypothetical protein
LIKDDFGQGVFTKVALLDVLLDDMQRVGKVQFEKLGIERLKVVTRIIMAELTIIACDPQMSLKLI